MIATAQFEIRFWHYMYIMLLAELDAFCFGSSWGVPSAFHIPSSSFESRLKV